MIVFRIYLILSVCFLKLDLLWAQEPKSVFDRDRYNSVKLYSLDTKICKSAKFFLDSQKVVSKCFKLIGPLNKNQLDEFLKIVSHKSSFGGDVLSCSTSDFGIIFFMDTSYVGYVSLSIKCNQLYSDMSIPANDKRRISAGVAGYYINPGFTKKARSRIIRWLGHFKSDVTTCP